MTPIYLVLIYIYLYIYEYYIYKVLINSNFNNKILPYCHEDYRIFLIFPKLIPTTLSHLLFSLRNVKYTSTAADQHQRHSA